MWSQSCVWSAPAALAAGLGRGSKGVGEMDGVLLEQAAASVAKTATMTMSFVGFGTFDLPSRALPDWAAAERCSRHPAGPNAGDLPRLRGATGKDGGCPAPSPGKSRPVSLAYPASPRGRF